MAVNGRNIRQIGEDQAWFTVYNTSKRVPKYSHITWRCPQEKRWLAFECREKGMPQHRGKIARGWEPSNGAFPLAQFPLWVISGGQQLTQIWSALAATSDVLR